MAKRASRSVLPPRKSGNPNVAIIIFLVFSLLGNIALGVFFYLGQEKIVAAEKKAKESDDKLKKQTADSLLVKDYYVVRLRALLDPNSVTPKEFDDMMRIRSERLEATGTKTPETPDDVWLGTLTKNIEAAIGKTYQKDTTQATAPKLQDVIANKDAEIKKLQGERNDALAKQKTAEDKQKQNEALWSQATFDAQFKKLEADIEKIYADRLATAVRQAADNKKLFDAKTKELGEFIQANEVREKELTAKHEKDREAWKKELAQVKLDMVNNVPGVDPRIKVGTGDELTDPRGNIVKAEANGETVIIDLGSDHKVVPQLTFSVHAIGTGGKPVREPKAKIEVISVLSKDQSLARVTRMYKPENARENDNPENDKNWVKDARDYWRVRNPILKGDVLFNPAWSPNRQIHIALNGMFDIDGDGKEDYATIRKLLEERGAIIDAWLDPEGGKFEMRGKITNKTELVVVGARPPMILNPAPPKEGDPKAEFKDGFEKMEREALSRAIEPITLKRFLARMGYTDLSLPSGKGGLGAPVEPGKKDPKDPKDPPKDMPK